MVVGTLNSVESAVVISDQRVITIAFGKMIFTALIVLLDIHFMEQIEYNPFVHEVMEFFQEKLFPCLKEGKLALLIPTCIAHLAVWRINSVAPVITI